ncbi:hypothetical protein ABID22_000328 [Pontibacter aydingkolensis]|uniref:Uncharacterized protein n=1 Tax=Pontibacter aydingkolensis TaxID=1911536 RepID=A0ABS7CQL6_9BACT|nr:hypothetical protein [Pontibacter aydingkolensis]MBW7466006.1 hypothetical protein [Pontibacter aydingkolensis]
MKKSVSTILLMLILCTIGSAQNFIYKGNNQYQATNSWSFELNGHYWTGDPEFTIAKQPNGGYLMISIDVPFKSNYIGGTVTVFLSDGTIITCTDKGIKDHVNNKSIALYSFTKAEIERLKSNRITRIRFSIKGGMEGTETFTADNRRMTYAYYDSDSKSYYETDIAVSELFE